MIQAEAAEAAEAKRLALEDERLETERVVARVRSGVVKATEAEWHAMEAEATEKSEAERLETEKVVVEEQERSWAEVRTRADDRWKIMKDNMIDILILNILFILIYTIITALQSEASSSPSLLFVVFIFTTPPLCHASSSFHRWSSFKTQIMLAPYFHFHSHVR